MASPRGPTDSLKMKEKDRQAIKDKFAGFNKAMEEILKYIFLQLRRVSVFRFLNIV